MKEKMNKSNGLPRGYFIVELLREYPRKNGGQPYSYYYWYLCKYIGDQFTPAYSGYHQYWLLGRADGKNALTEEEAHERALEKLGF